VSIADRAWFARKHVPGLKVFGGIVLVSAVGGINPNAVNWMWQMQGGFGRVVWLPTFDADNHVKHFKDAPEGIKVLGGDGKVLPVVKDVPKICAEQKLIVQTGHLSPTEARARRDAGATRMVVTHAQFEVVNMSFECGLDGGEARTVRNGYDNGTGGASRLDAALAASRDRSDGGTLGYGGETIRY
jgi:hypothetical protein